ncbi:hypothetical protein SAMN05444377_101240 [Flavobacterium fontis]|uniref:Uncharacterized protein n=1 Tax=Flavobacterium fontis TaxID=1124188 RepID=A0A1M4WBH7_9FLAO|nr:hypothetical protein [Flavobacterium fontis]SHE78525.1 hypothetical protein SAMN05444377_101240 [Flavobacterium fontis]
MISFLRFFGGITVFGCVLIFIDGEAGDSEMKAIYTFWLIVGLILLFGPIDKIFKKKNQIKEDSEELNSKPFHKKVKKKKKDKTKNKSKDKIELDDLDTAMVEVGTKVLPKILEDEMNQSKFAFEMVRVKFNTKTNITNLFILDFLKIKYQSEPIEIENNTFRTIVGKITLQPHFIGFDATNSLSYSKISYENEAKSFLRVAGIFQLNIEMKLCFHYVLYENVGFNTFTLRSYDHTGISLNMGTFKKFYEVIEFISNKHFNSTEND